MPTIDCTVIGCLKCATPTICEVCNTDIGFHPVGWFWYIFRRTTSGKVNQCMIMGELYLQNSFKVFYIVLGVVIIAALLGKYLLRRFYVKWHDSISRVKLSQLGLPDNVTNGLPNSLLTAVNSAGNTEAAKAVAEAHGKLHHHFTSMLENAPTVGPSHEEIIEELKAADSEELGRISLESMRYAMYHMRWVRIMDWTGLPSAAKTQEDSPREVHSPSKDGFSYSLLQKDITDLFNQEVIPREYPACVDAHTDDLCGVGVPLFYHFHILPFTFALSLLLATGSATLLSGISGKYLAEGQHADQELAVALRHYAEYLFKFLGIAWVVNICACFFHHITSWNIAHRFNTMNSTMYEYTLLLEGVPTDIISEGELQEIIEKELQVQLIGVSIIIDMQADAFDGQRVCDVMWQMHERLVVKLDLTFKSSEVPGLTDQIHFGYDHHLVPAEDIIAMKPESEKKLFGKLLGTDGSNMKLRSIGEAAIVFKSKSDLENVFKGTRYSERHKLCQVTGKDGTTHDVIARRTIEPTALEWFNMGRPASEVRCRAFKGISVLFLIITIICVAVYLPMNWEINLKYRVLRSSPPPFTAHVIGVVTGLMGSLLFPLLFQIGGFIGFTMKPTFDMLALSFCLANNTINFVSGNIVALAQHFWEGKKHRLNIPVDGVEFNATDLRVALAQEYLTGDFFFAMMVPGLLFMGFLIGKFMGDLWPPVQHFLTTCLVFKLRCLPDKVNVLIANAIPWNPRVLGKDGKTRLPLSARAAEYIWDVKLFDLAWEYPDKIWNCAVACLPMVALSERTWIMYAFLLAWVVLMYIWHRFIQLHTYKKYMNTDIRVDAMAVAAWKFPLASLAFTFALWGQRLHYWGPPCLVVLPLVSTVILWVCDYLIFYYGSHKNWKGHGTDESYEATARRHLYTWFNTNPAYVLKSHYAPELLGKNATKYIPPFFYGKEYLFLAEPPQSGGEQDFAAAKVTVNGKQFTAEDITDGKVVIEEGTFIIGYDDLANKDSVLRELTEFGWEPTSVMSASPLIVGRMDGPKIAETLAIEGVKYIEADGQVSIAEKG